MCFFFFHFSAPQHSWCTQCTQPSRVAGVCHLCVTDKLTVARHHAAVSDRHFLLSLPFFCRKANVELARCGFSLRQRTRAFSPFSVVVENKVSILNMVRVSYKSRANVVKLIRSGLRYACCKLLRTPTWWDASSRLYRHLHGTWCKNNMVFWVWVDIIAIEIGSQSRVWLA